MRDVFTAEKKSQVLAVLDKWFLRDDNAVPPQYILQPISSRLPHFNDPKFPAIQKQHRDEWWSTFELLQSNFRKAANKCASKGTMSPAIANLFTISVTNDEVENGILHYKASHEDKCLCFVRIFSDIKDHLKDSEAKNFIDLPWGQDKPDQEAQSLLNDLRDTKVPGVLPAGNIFKFTVPWNPTGGVNPGAEPLHREYLDGFLDNFYTTIVELIDRGVQQQAETTGKIKSDPLLEEVLQHLTYCQKLASTFRGREDLLAQVGQYVDAGSAPENASAGALPRHPLVIFGESGCGKTSFMAKAVAEAKVTRPAATVILRFLGTTTDSSSIFSVLGGVTRQIIRAYGQDALLAQIPTDFQELTNFFQERLALATAEHPLVIFLDSLDQLSQAFGAHRMSWLPKTLPPHVSLVLSTLPVEYNCLDTLRGVLPKDSPNFAEVRPLPVAVGMEILDSWLAATKKQLSPQQRTAVSKAVERCPLPLYLKLVFNEMLKWKSYTTVQALPPTIPDLIHTLFARVEKEHGKILVSHALGLITSSRQGLAEAELEDMLSLDDQVLQDVYQYWLPPIRRIPSLLWTRIKGELDSYISERDADGSLVVYWYHRQFIQVARSRYLLKTGAQLAGFSADEVTLDSLSPVGVYLQDILSEYFMGSWAEGRKKPFQYTDKQQASFGLASRDGAEDRYLASQPLTFGGDLYQSPAAAAGDGGEQKLTFNLRKVANLPYHLTLASDPQSLKEHALCNFDFLYAKIATGRIAELQADLRFALAFFDDPELHLISHVLKLCSTSLVANFKSTPYELAGRLARFQDSTSHPLVASLYQQACRVGERTLTLMPMFQPFPGPGGELLATLEGHSSSLIRALLTPDSRAIVSTAQDMTLKFWDLESSTLIQSLRLKWFSDPLVSPNGKLIVTVPQSSSPTCVWSFATTELLFSLKGNSSKAPCLITTDNKYFVSSPSSLENGIRVWSLETGEEVGTLAGHTKEITSLACCSLPNFLVSSSRDGTLRQWDLATKTCLKVITPTVQGPIHRVWFSANEKQLLVSFEGGNFLVLDSPAGTQRLSFPVPDTWRDVVTWRATKDFSHLALATADGYLRILRTATGETVKDFKPSGFRIEGMLELFADKFLLYGLKGQEPPHVLDIFTGESFGVLPFECIGMTRFPDDRRLLMACNDRTLKVVDLAAYFSGAKKVTEAAQPTGFEETHGEDQVGRLFLGLGPDTLISGDKDIMQWDVTTGALTARIPTRAISVLAISKDSQTLAVTSVLQQGLEILRHPFKESTVHYPMGEVNLFASIFTLDDQYLLVINRESAACVLRTSDWSVLHTLEFGVTRTVLLSDSAPGDIGGLPTGTFLIASGNDLRQYDPVTNASRVVGSHDTQITAMGTSASFGVTADAGGLCRLWDVPTRSVRGEYDGTRGSQVYLFSFTRDSRLVCALTDKNIHVWELATGKPVFSMRDEHQLVNVLFSPFGKYLFGTGWGSNVHVWEVATGRYLGATNLHAGCVTAVTSPPSRREKDGHAWLIVGKGDGRIIKLKISGE